MLNPAKLMRDEAYYRRSPANLSTTTRIARNKAYVVNLGRLGLA